MKYLTCLLATLASSLFVVACNTTDSQAAGGGRVFDSSLPFSTFQAEPDMDKKQALAGEILAALSVPACWDASFLGPATPSGSVGSVSQFSFNGQGGYRYVGFETHAGGMSLVEVGRYKGKPAMLVSTWSGNTEGIILVDKGHFEHVMSTPSGDGYYGVTFWTSNGPCL
jgi:hypothetical protein